MARRINLVPPSERARTTTNVGMLGLIAGVLIVLFGLGLGYYLLSNSLDDRKKELEDVKSETQQVVAQVTSLRQYEDLAADREATEELVRGVYANRTLVADLLDAISLVVPENVWFDSLGLTTADPGPTVDQAGRVTTGSGGNSMSLDGSTYSFEDVAQLLVRLQLISTLSEIDLGSASSASEDATVKSFSIEAVVEKPQDTDVPLPLSQVEVEGL
ncbi:MAG: PilN domain-containing protein [Thermoleophilia bacterium]|nr:PilN domain-containing protein [Thermoleophilia bacterium]